jgi:hypothetical protein
VHTFLRKFGRGIATTMLAIASFSVATAAPAVATDAKAAPAVAAVTCGPSAPDRDSSTSQVINQEPGFSGPAMRTGPGTNCPILIRVPWGTVVPLNCFRSGDTVNGISTWSAAHYAGKFGWVSDYYLSHLGSFSPC